MSTEGVGAIADDIQKVKDLIEHCLVRYMNQRQVIETLYQEQKILPSLTNILWRILEMQNREFFKHYYPRVTLKEQIEKFNILLEKQDAMMNPNEIPPMHHPVATTVFSPNDFNNNSGPCIHSGTLDDAVAKFQNPNDGLNVNNEFGYLRDVMEPHITIDGSLFGQIDSYSHPTIDYQPLTNMNSNLHRTSNNESISNRLETTLWEDISQFVLPHPENLLDSSKGITIENQGDNTRLPNIPGNLDFQNSEFVQQ